MYLQHNDLKITNGLNVIDFIQELKINNTLHFFDIY